MMRTPGTELFGMKEIEDLGKNVPGCPHCGSLDLQRDKGLAECHHGPWSGRDHEGGMPRAIAMDDEYDRRLITISRVVRPVRVAPRRRERVGVLAVLGLAYQAGHRA